jgi:IS5 family transposase
LQGNRSAVIETLQFETDMKPKPRPESSQLDLFQARFDQLLNVNHPLCILALADCYSPETGAPGKDIRPLVGLHYLKHAFNESDESLLDHWVENPYWQYFCGFSAMQHDVPLHSTSLTKWRQRIGADRLAVLLEETVAIALTDQHITRKELAQVIVDTTVQEKNITHPTDSKLYFKALEKLAAAARNRSVQLRQTYLRVGKKAAIMVGRYAHAKQFRRMRNRLRKLRTWLGRVLRDIRPKVSQPDVALEEC